MATDFDPYAILQVERSAGQDEIDQAYRRQWAAYPNDPTPDLRLRELQTAYRILSDPDERRAYDTRLAERGLDGYSPMPSAELASGVPPTRVPWGVKQILQSIAIVIGGAILVSIPIFLLADSVAGDTEVDDDPEALAILFVASAAFQVFALGAAWWFSLRKFRLGWNALGIRKPERGMPWLPFSLVTMGLLIVGVYGLALDLVGINPDTDLPDAAYDNALPLIIIIVLTIAVAPVVEEIFFRGFVFAGLAARWGWIVGAIGSAALFGAAHLGNSGYFYVVPPIVAIGILFAWSYHFSKSILPAIGGHLMFNLIQVVGVLIAR
jgi:membrane protease YdiL (CAAX protease family)